MEEYKIARLFRDSRIGTIGGGTSEIMREIIAKMIIDDKSYTQAGKTMLPTNGQRSKTKETSKEENNNQSIKNTIMSVLKFIEIDHFELCSGRNISLRLSYQVFGKP